MRALKVLVIVMGVLIVAGTVTLVALIVQRAGRAVTASPAPAASPAPFPAPGAPTPALGQPTGSRIAGIAGAGERVALWVQRPDGDRVVLVDARTGQPVGEIRLSD